jgi:hypothetical protein
VRDVSFWPPDASSSPDPGDRSIADEGADPGYVPVGDDEGDDPAVHEPPVDELADHGSTGDLPTMADLDALGRHLDQIDATLARMDAESVA